MSTKTNSCNIIVDSVPSTWYTLSSSTSTGRVKKSEFGGAFLKVTPSNQTFTVNSITNVMIEKVIYNDPATIVFWDDGTKTVAKCSEEDKYSPETGLAICCLKKLATPTQVRNLFDDWMPTTGGNIVTMKDVRRKHKIVEFSK